MQPIYLYSLSGLSIILGFIALLKQRTYIDADTKQPTEIEVPIFGKLKSNYPALIFVFLGFDASIFAYDRSERYNREVFKGTTDRYGRIIINIRTGTYQIEVNFRGKTYKRAITINGRREFKNINFTSIEGR